MRNLFQFLWRYNFFLYFIILEVISFTLIFNTSYYQKSSMLSTTNSFTAKVNEVGSNITRFFTLNKENEELRKENAQLRSVLTRVYKIEPAKVPDSVLNFKFKYIGAKVISNSVNKRNNYFMLDKGSRDGVTIDMGVVTIDGVAGIIVAVSAKYSMAMSVLHKDSRISGKLKNYNQLVNITWDGKDYRIGVVEDIPTHISLRQGDTVLTSGHSHIFPEGLMIGTIREVDKSFEQLFITGILDFSNDFNSLYSAYIIQNFDRQELEYLEAKQKNE